MSRETDQLKAEWDSYDSRGHFKVWTQQDMGIALAEIARLEEDKEYYRVLWCACADTLGRPKAAPADTAELDYLRKELDKSRVATLRLLAPLECEEARSGPKDGEEVFPWAVRTAEMLECYGWDGVEGAAAFIARLRAKALEATRSAVS